MSTPAGRLRALLEAVEDRTGARAALRRLLDRPVPGGPCWGRAPAVALALLVLHQLLTGFALAVFYAPSTTTAWESVHWIEETVVLGALVRGLHAAGASAIVVLLAAHLLASGLRRAYRAPAEAAWLSGLVLVPVVLGFALTGYLLPWDQRGYWATQVAVGIARATPLVGPPAATALQGGATIGTATLTRFYGLHTMLLPALLVALAALHVALARRAAARQASPAGAAATPWWPGQASRDLGLAVLVLLAMAAWAKLEGPGLHAPADPGSDFPPRPEWYFAPLRQLLITVPEPWGSVVLPGLLGLALAALPWLDPAGRPRTALARGLLVGPLAVALLLGGLAWQKDAVDEDYQAAMTRAKVDAELARQLAREGIPPGGAAEQLRLHPPRRGRALFAVHCQGCHALEGKGGGEAPDLTGYLTPGWLQGVVRTPRDPRYFGATKLDDMPALEKVHWPKLPALAAFLRAQDPGLRARLDPKLVEQGDAAYFELECHGCHAVKPGEVGSAPNLAGYGSAEWLREFLRRPGADRFYGDLNDMPHYEGELAPDELEALVVFLRGLDPAAPPYVPPAAAAGVAPVGSR